MRFQAHASPPRVPPPLLFLDDGDGSEEAPPPPPSGRSLPRSSFESPSSSSTTTKTCSSSSSFSPKYRMRHAVGIRRVKGPIDMDPPRRVLRTSTTTKSHFGNEEEEEGEDVDDEEEEEKHAGEETASEISSFSSPNNVKPPNPWKVDVHSEANRISFDFARARDGVVQKIEQLHRQATERFHRTHQKHDREAKRMKETIEKLEKEVQKKTEIEANVVEKVRTLGEFRRNARFAARMLRVWREKTREANEPGKRIRENIVLRRSFCTFRKNAKIARALKERRANESSYAFAQAASMRRDGFGRATQNHEIDQDAEALRKQLEIANKKLAETDARSSQMEQTMRQAFMRGVCALNLEAMKLMRTEDGAIVQDENEQDEGCKAHQRPVSPETVVRRAYEKAAKINTSAHNVCL